LGLFAGKSAEFFCDGNTAFSQLVSPVGLPARWRPFVSPDGSVTLFNGDLDNADEISGALGLGGISDPSQIYAAALLNWGNSADLRCVGAYCAITVDAAQTTLRLVRSPLIAPPLHYWHADEQCVAASVPRVLHAAGLESKIDPARLTANILFDHTDEERGWYIGARRVPVGCRVIANRDGVRTERYYDPLAIPVHSLSEEDALEGVARLLDEAAAKGTRGAQRPGVLLSGGLDSPLMALSVLKALPVSQDLPSFTFVPSCEWDGMVTAGRYGDERPLVEAFARMHPRIQPHFFANEEIWFDHRLNDLFLAIGEAPASLTTYHMYHALWQAARAEGCDRLICADFGNFSYSQTGAWAAAEYLRRGQWRQMLYALDSDPADSRSLLRRFAAKAVLPNLPPRLRTGLRHFVKGPRPSQRQMVSAATRALHARYAERLGRSGTAYSMEGFVPRDRNEGHAQWATIGDGSSGDIRQGFEQIYGIRQRDMAAYRPLVEFCLSLPTERFNHGGVTRRVARRLGEGLVPEEIRKNTRTGLHGVDWHAKIGRRRPELIAQFERLRDDFELAELIDLDRLIGVLRDWPDQSSYDMEVMGPRLVAVSQGVLHAAFVRFVDGRNSP
jgi:asparagine synthase (glutamine-hydrolysing)